MTGEDTLMWEVSAAPGGLAELLAWANRVAVAHLDHEPTCTDTAIYTSEQDDAARVVIIAGFTGEPTATLPEPPAHLVVRAPHQWPFRRLR